MIQTSNPATVSPGSVPGLYRTAIRERPAKRNRDEARRPIMQAVEDVRQDAPAGVEPVANAVFAQLVKDHRTRLHRFVMKHIGQTSEAEDIVQQAFTEAFSAYHNFDNRSALSTWLYGIALNIIRNYLSRSPHRRFTFESDTVLDDLICSAPNPEDQAVMNEMMKTLQSEIEQLPCETQSILKLLAVEDASYVHVAEALSLPTGTVRSRLSRARETLRKRLKEAHHELEFA